MLCPSIQTSDLGVAVEGGLGSPLGGKIVVSLVFEDGVAFRSGKYLHTSFAISFIMRGEKNYFNLTFRF